MRGGDLYFRRSRAPPQLAVEARARLFNDCECMLWEGGVYLWKHKQYRLPDIACVGVLGGDVRDWGRGDGATCTLKGYPLFCRWVARCLCVCGGGGRGGGGMRVAAAAQGKAGLGSW